ncbi:pyridoxal-phosphate-dependent aminotransferase family protein [Oceanomicrobium pacificus]|uniref:Aminotransferase class V-fold PLP-dependent enzyme n=1 Tax=Oceanomicrobium pacificus TaxID=2692916 RepID=A0A6B0TNA2_9RHOB|nr:aminotransferase class V-fold PLP-dependent enzyme [Oceanomicrobium pacificus]MXU66080.1 aminotransferase class V-fold PLP-dependent enzyme [Oceanomicrobium pacificus]
MSLSNGRDLRSIPGPSVIPDRVLNAMHRASPNIYEGELVDMADGIYADLRRLAGTAFHPVIYLSNGHGAWEASVSNLMEEGDHILVLTTGRFGAGWAEMAEAHGVIAECKDFGMDGHADPHWLEDRLRQPDAGRIKAILVVQTDTSTSVHNNIPALRAAIDAAGHDALFMVDCIASLGCARYEMDAWGVDVTIGASQKGLMVPPGLGLTFHNEKAERVQRAKKRHSAYWNWEPRVHGGMFYQKFAGTAPTHHLFGLRESLTMILHEEGLEHVWHRHRALQGAVGAAVTAWAADGPMRFNIADPAYRSPAVTTLHLDGVDASVLRRWCEEQSGLTLGVGLGFSNDRTMQGRSVFRIGHMGHLNPPMILGALATLDAGLKALAIPHGRGALDAAADAIAAAQIETAAAEVGRTG